jgi:50S ribosomal subunit-associated GTPase HflX
MVRHLTNEIPPPFEASTFPHQYAAALLVFDITDSDSFARVKTWVKELKTMAGKPLVLVLAGNKVDLERNRQVPEADAQAYATSIGATLIGTSAKSNKGVEQAFLHIARSAPLRHLNTPVVFNAKYIYCGILFVQSCCSRAAVRALRRRMGRRRGGRAVQ